MRKHAFFVGINGYKHLDQLRYARQDAESMSDALKRCYGFSDDDITLMTDESNNLPEDRLAIENALSPDVYASDLDLFIFGFWGHGIWEGDQRYLCPMNVQDARLADTALSLKNVQELLGHIQAKNNCLILDCCQNEVFTDARSAIEGQSAIEAMAEGEETSLDMLARNIVGSLKKNTTDPDYDPTVVVLNSCRKGERAFESVERRHGLFTAELLEAMEKRFKSTSELYEYVRDNVRDSIRDRVPESLRVSGVYQTPYYTCAGGSNILLPAVEKGFDVFLSCRRDGGTVLAKQIQTQLESRNLRVFMNIDEPVSGSRFDEKLLTQIEDSTCFVPILSPGCFSRPKTMSSCDRVAEAVRQPGKLNHDAMVMQMATPYRASEEDATVSSDVVSSVPMQSVCPFIGRGFIRAISPTLEKYSITDEELNAEQLASQELEKPSLTVPTDVPTLAKAYARIPNGGTIFLEPGVYKVPQTIAIRKNVTIIGDVNHPENVVLQGGKTCVLYLRSGNAEIAGLTIENKGEKGFFGVTNSSVLFATPHGSLHDCVFTSTNGCGLLVTTKDSNPNVKNCTARNCGGVGFIIASGASGTFLNCTAIGNAYGGFQIGGSQSHPTVEDCTFEKNLSGIVVGHGASGTFRNCTIRGNVKAGLMVGGTQGNLTVEDCQFIDGKDEGISISSGASGTFRNCTFSGNAKAGMVIRDPHSHPTVEDSQFIDGKDNGVSVRSGGSGTFRNCIFSGNAKTGMMVYGEQSNPTVEDCHFTDGKDDGVSVFTGALGTFRNCSFSGNNGQGMVVYGAQSNPTVEDCYFTDGKDSGVSFSSGGSGTFRNCIFSGNANAEMRVFDVQSNPTVEDCHFTDGTNTGILICSGGAGTFRNCTVSGSVKTGMVVRGAQSNPTVEDCHFIDGKSYGVIVFDGASGTFRNCTVRGNADVGMGVQNAQSNPTVEDCHITDGKSAGIIVVLGASGTFRNCTVSGNADVGMVVQNDQSNPTVEDCHFTDGKNAGIIVSKGALGTFRNCIASGNAEAGMVVKDAQTNPMVEDCTYENNQRSGVYVHDGASGTFRRNKLSGNTSQGKEDNWDVSGAASDLVREENMPNE